MSTIRVVKRDDPYVRVDKTAVNDPRPSWSAKGLLMYLLSKPDDWKVRVTDLVKHAADGRDACYKIINELIALGYIVRKELVGERGRKAGYDYEIYETPLHYDPIPSKDGRKRNKGNPPHTEIQDTVKIAEIVDNSPYTESPDTVSPDTVRPDTENPDITKNDSTELDFTKEDEEYYYTPAIIQENVRSLAKAYPQYAALIQHTQRFGPFIPDRAFELFLEEISRIPVHPDDALEIYVGIADELNRSTVDVMTAVVRKYRSALHRQSLHAPASWFMQTWRQELRSAEQQALIETARRTAGR